jgi:ketosteroid isomerase-like protein
VDEGDGGFDQLAVSAGGATVGEDGGVLESHADIAQPSWHSRRRGARDTSAMASENAELVRTALEAFNREGIDAIADLVHPDFETTTPASLSVEPDTYRGPDGLRRWMDAWGDTMDAIRFEVDELVDAGDHVVAVTRLVARSHTTGIELEQGVAMMWTLRDGRAAGMQAFATREEALRAAGLEA